MPSTQLSQEQIDVRRNVRRQRRVRRRRLAALLALGAFAALAVGVVVGRGGEGRSAVRGSVATEPSAAPQPAPRRATTAATPSRGRLGSGKPVTLAFGGDVHFESPIRERLDASPASVLAPISPILGRADVAVVNLETAVTERGSPASKAYTFRAPASAFDALKAGGVDVANVANNHGMDYGRVGLRDTLAAARRAGVPVIGAGWSEDQAYAPHRVTVDGQRVAVIGATQVLDDHLIGAWSASPGRLGLASAKDEPRLVRAVRAARRANDTVVVFLHWGLELSTCPTGVQRSLARKPTAAGADVVVGSHAHVLLGAGRMGKALVAYGLGNFVFYAFRELTAQTGVLEVTVTGRRVDGYRWVPARIAGGIPYPLGGGERASALASWRSLRSCTGLRP